MSKFSVDNGVISIDEANPHIPAGVTRVKILNHAGQEKWRDPKDFEPDDKVLIANGCMSFMHGKPGRKPQREDEDDTSPQPTTEDAKEADLLRQSFLEREPILSGIRQDPSSDGVLEALMKGLAEEQAALAFERKSQEARNGPISQISLRRVNALKTLTECWFKRKEQLATKEIDLNSKEFEQLFRYVNETFIDALARSNLEHDTISVIKNEFQALVSADSWVSGAKKRMKEA